MKTPLITQVAAGGRGRGRPDGVRQRPVTGRAARRPGEIVLRQVGSNPNDHTTFDADTLPRVISGCAPGATSS